MTITVEAIYEQGVLKPKQPLQLDEGAAVQITVEPAQPVKDPLANVIGIGDGPGDGAENHDQYIYGKIRP